MATWKTVPLTEVITGSNADLTIASGTQLGQPQEPDTWSAATVPPVFDGEQPGVWSVQLNVPSATTPEGCIFEIGGNIRGVYLGFDGNGDLIWRFHNGVNRRIVVDSSLIPRDQTITITAEILHVGGFYVSSNPSLFPDRPLDRGRVWVNLNHRGICNATSVLNSKFSQDVGGQVNGFWNGVVGNRIPFIEAGNHDQDVTTSGVTFVSGLRYYHNAIVENPAKFIGTVNVLQEEAFNRRALWLDAQDSRVSWTSTRDLRIDYANSTFITQVVWDHNRISDVKFEDHETHQVTWLNSKTLREL